MLGAVLVLWLLWALLNGVVIRQVIPLADGLFAVIEQTFDEGREQPIDPMITGSEASLVTWEDLGNRGRDFVRASPIPPRSPPIPGKTPCAPCGSMSDAPPPRPPRALRPNWRWRS